MSLNCAIKIDRIETKLSLNTAIRNPVTSLSYMIFTTPKGKRASREVLYKDRQSLSE